MPDLTGQWAGQLVGTNAGYLFLQLHQDGDSISGTLRFNDLQLGICVYSVAGTIADKLEFELTPSVAPEGVTLGTVRAVAVLVDDTLSGDWETDQETAGTFSAYRQSGSGLLQTATHDTGESKAEQTALDVRGIAVQTDQRQRRIPTCSVDSASLKRIYRQLVSAANEATQLEVAAVRSNPQLLGKVANPERMDVLLQEYERRVQSLNAVGISIEGAKGEHIVTFDDSALEEDRLPRPLRSISLETGLLYRTTQPSKVAPNRAVVVLDFTKPPAVDISNPVGTPTPNSSAILVSGSNPTWVSGVDSQLDQILSEERNRWDWLHSSHTYQILLFVLGLPLSISIASMASDRLVLSLRMDPLDPFRTAITVYVFFAALLLFRIGFSFIRWLYPRVEVRRESRPFYLRVRGWIVAVLLSAVGSLIASATGLAGE